MFCTRVTYGTTNTKRCEISIFSFISFLTNIKQKDPAPLGEISLTVCVARASLRFGKKNCFEIIIPGSFSFFFFVLKCIATTGRIYYALAEDSDSRMQWINMVNQAQGAHRKTLLQSSKQRQVQQQQQETEKAPTPVIQSPREGKGYERNPLVCF